jgi:Domain of Unknown Function (DUF1080)
MVRSSLVHVSRLLAALVLFAGPAELSAAELKAAELTAEDFLTQGEYAGDVFDGMGAAPIGMQVVAEDNGKFTAFGFNGGLPGAGWDRRPPDVSKGVAANGVTTFAGVPGGQSATIEQGVMTITEAGVKIAELKKVDRESPTLDMPPPDGAIVLFDGTDASAFAGGMMNADKRLLPGCVSRESFGSGRLHVEFRIPYQPNLTAQARGNSGVFLQGRYEVHIRDSFGLAESDIGCGAIYKVKGPDQNLCFPPFTWQTFDIDFTPPEFKDGEKVEGSQAMMTVRQNGVLVQRKTRLRGPTPNALVADVVEKGPIYLRDGRSPVRFRNIWFLPK